MLSHSQFPTLVPLSLFTVYLSYFYAQYTCVYQECTIDAIVVVFIIIIFIIFIINTHILEQTHLKELEFRWPSTNTTFSIPIELNSNTQQQQIICIFDTEDKQRCHHSYSCFSAWWISFHLKNVSQRLSPIYNTQTHTHTQSHACRHLLKLIHIAKRHSWYYAAAAAAIIITIIIDVVVVVRSWEYLTAVVDRAYIAASCVHICRMVL